MFRLMMMMMISWKEILRRKWIQSLSAKLGLNCSHASFLICIVIVDRRCWWCQKDPCTDIRCHKAFYLFILLISNTIILCPSMWQAIRALKWERKEIEMTAFNEVLEWIRWVLLAPVNMKCGMSLCSYLGVVLRFCLRVYQSSSIPWKK